MRISLLGPPHVHGADGRGVAVPSKKGRALIWYCAAQSGASFPRAVLADLLWSDSVEGLNCLSTALVRLRRSLPVLPLRLVGDAIGWDPDAGVDVDAHRFLSLVGAEGSEAEVEERLSTALALWRGPFLDGVQLRENDEFNAWIETQRQAWQRRMLDALEQLIGLGVRREAWERVAAHARRALEVDPLQERFHRSLISALHRQGDRAAALAQFAACRQLLRRELLVEPEPATLMLGQMVSGQDDERPAAGATPGPQRAPLPLVGRGPALLHLQAALRQGAQGGGAGRLALVGGQPGIGKSRIVADVVHDARSTGEFASVLVGHCHPEFQAHPYLPLAGALADALLGLDAASLRLKDVWREDLQRLLPAWRGGEDRRPPAPTSPDEGRRRLLEAVAGLLAALPSPVLIVLEDIHWADDATMAVVAHLARSGPPTPAALLLTARSGEMPPQTTHLLERLEHEGRLARLDLPPLSLAAMAALTKALVGYEDTRLAERLYAYSRGVPLFAVEFLRHRLDERARRGGDRATALQQVPIPLSVRAVIRSRLDGIPHPHRRLLEAAAIFPSGAPQPVLERVAGMKAEDAGQSMQGLLHGQLLQASDGAAPGDTRYCVAHDLIRAAVLDEAARAHVATLHSRAYQALATEGSPAELALHATAGGLWEEGLNWSLQAAQAAERSYAYGSAAGFLRQALACLAELPQTPERRLKRDDVRHWLLEAEGVEQVNSPRAGSLVAADGDTDHPALPDETDEEAHAEGIMPLLLRGHLEEANAHIEASFARVRLTGNQKLFSLYLKFAGYYRYLKGDLPASITLMKEALDLYARLDHRLYPGDVVFCLAAAEVDTGAFSASRERVDRLLQAAAAEANPVLAANALIIRGALAHRTGRWQEAAASAQEGIAKAEEGKSVFFRYLNAVHLGLPVARLGDLQEGIRLQQAATRLGEDARIRTYLDRSYAWLGEMLLEAGDRTAALSACRSGLAVAQTDGYGYGDALNTHLLGLIASAEGRRGEAEAHLNRALKIFGAMEAKPDVARCHDTLGRVASADEDRAKHRAQARALRRSKPLAPPP